jgi:hypothetical protein
MEKLSWEATLKGLNKIVDKKLIWCGYDENQEIFYLFFEGMDAIAVQEASIIADGKVVAEKILEEKLDEANHLLKLKSIVDAKPEAMPDPTKDGSDGIEV